MNREIWKVLKGHKSDNVYLTHVSLFGNKGKFCINRNNQENFWETYCSTLQEDPTMLCGVAEKPQPYLPVLVDVDIARKMSDDEDRDSPVPIYNENHVKKLVEIYQNVLRQILDECSEEDLHCVFLKKDPYVSMRKDSYYTKHGFHLHFPYIFLNRVEHEAHLIPRIKDQVGKNKIFEDVGFVDSASLIDTSYSKVPWLLYGGRKAADKDPYLVDKVFDHQQKETTLEKAFGEYVLLDKNEQEIEIVGKVEYYLPRILSIIPFGRDIKELRSGLPAPMDAKRKPKQPKRTREELEDIDFHENIEMVRQLVAMLDDKRANDRNEWIRIGWVLFNIGNGCDEAREMWLEFSQRCGDKYDEQDCIRHWDKMVKKDYTIGSLRHFASMDSPDEYDKLRDANVKKYIQQSLSGSHNDIARALYELYGTEFICASLKHKLWFQFRNHRWQEIEEGIYLQKKISGAILEKYTSLSKEYFDKLSNASDAGEQAMYKERVKQLMKLVGSLKSAPFKRNVMKECMEVFYDGSFLKKLNKNPYLIGFQNGVYDTRTHGFRAGSPEDYISLQMAIEYKIFDNTAVEMAQVKDFLSKVFPDKSVREYFMDTSSDVFVGGNHSKIVQVWTGEGDNAKSITQILFEKMLGEYAVKLPTSLIIGKRTQSSAACPELVRAGNGVRFAVLQEPDQKDIINIGILKELSGNDTFFARGLFKEGGEITPMFKLVLICNEPPQLPYGDKAVWNRIRVIPYEATFCDDAPETLEQQILEKRYPKDRQFADKIPGMVEAFAYLLLERRKQTRKHFEPAKVKMATEGYRKKNDIYRQFIEESIIDDAKKKISLLELYTSFKEWFKESLPNHQIPIKNDVLIYFTKSWGEPGRGVKWAGKRMRTLQDDINSGEAMVLEGEDFDEENLPDI
jgi:P4 family phage/plasmid primase-like protien